MMKQYVRNFLILVHFCLMMIFLGGVFFETFVSYPNWFHNIPASLEATNNFFQVRNPGHFFQKVVPLSILTGIGFVISAWRVVPARTFIIFSVILMVAIEALTIVYIYPRIGAMIHEGLATYSAEALKQTAQEFMTANQVRVAFIVIAEALSLTGLWKFMQHKFSSDAE